ncbi:MAG: branched-chain amino acid transaminase [Gammaproteobacteria bacterium]|nr:branched-chain amino acid transaminase [Gammaproteobacteria bacterium]
MQATEFIWQNGNMVAWDQANTHVLSHAMHYGSAVFEGIRVYKTDNGPAVFKLKEHIERLFYSAKQLGMQIPYSQAQICQAIIYTIQKNKLEESYIRPLVYYGYGSMKVVPTDELPVETIIAVWPWGDYLPVKAVDIVISDYIRIHPKSTIADAKISGHYVNSILAGLALRNTHYHEALLLDADGYVAEGSAENIFIVKDGKISTTPAGTILKGITRDTVIQIAKEFGITVEQRRFKPEEVFNADEAFFCGTAVEVTAIRSLNDRKIGKNDIGPLTEKFKMRYHQVVRGEAPEYQHGLTFVPSLKIAEEKVA